MLTPDLWDWNIPTISEPNQTSDYGDPMVGEWMFRFVFSVDNWGVKFMLNPQLQHMVCQLGWQ